ncbi:hypothetical protein CCP4SC76_3140004 [Gammaproteobacteria bacterium]
MKTDSLIYRLFQRWPELGLELAGLEAMPVAGYVLRAEEIKQTAFRLDGVLVPPEGLDRPLVFIEAQFQPDPDFHARWLSTAPMPKCRNPVDLGRTGVDSPQRGSGLWRTGRSARRIA